MSICYLWQDHREEPCPACGLTASPPWPHEASWPEPEGVFVPLAPERQRAAWIEFAEEWNRGHPGEPAQVPLSALALSDEEIRAINGEETES